MKFYQFGPGWFILSRVRKLKKQNLSSARLMFSGRKLNTNWSETSMWTSSCASCPPATIIHSQISVPSTSITVVTDVRSRKHTPKLNNYSIISLSQIHVPDAARAIRPSMILHNSVLVLVFAWVPLYNWLVLAAARGHCHSECVYSSKLLGVVDLWRSIYYLHGTDDSMEPVKWRVICMWLHNDVKCELMMLLSSSALEQLWIYEWTEKE